MSSPEGAADWRSRLADLESGRSTSAAGANRTLPPIHRLVALECSLATTSLDALEVVARELALERIRERFAQTKAIRELAVLRTCHRVELYGWTDSPEEVEDVLTSGTEGDGRWRARLDGPAALHLFRVAAGLESTAVGEREARDQVRLAARTVLSRSPRPVLRPLLTRSARAAEAAALHVPADRSIAALAAARLLEGIGPVPPAVLVLGTGAVGRAVAELLADHARVTLLYRTRPPEPEFLRATHARAAPWNDLAEEVDRSDAIVAAMKSGGRILGRGSLTSRARPILVIDLGLPRNVDPSVRDHPALRLVDLEGLRAWAPPAPLPDVEEGVALEAAEAARELAAIGFESWVAAYRRASERIRRGLLEEVRPTLAALGPADREAIERLTRRLVARLLEAPTAGLRSIPPGPEGDARRRGAADLLGLDALRS